MCYDQLLIEHEANFENPRDTIRLHAFQTYHCEVGC